MYLSVDGGGSKLTMLLYDEEAKPVAIAASGGIDTAYAAPEQCWENLGTCLKGLFCDVRPGEIELVCGYAGGAEEMLLEQLQGHVPVAAYEFMDEGQMGLLAGILADSGILAHAGTGSEIFCCRDGQTVDSLGGWGLLLGDQGSGAWMGKQALEAVAQDMDGWGEKTTLTVLLRQAWQVRERAELLDAVYGDASPIAKIASATQVLQKAMEMNDRMAQDIVRQAGKSMSKQALAFIRRNGLEESDYPLTCQGGAWKVHPLMYAVFARDLEYSLPSLDVKKPAYEPVVAGVVRHIRNRHPAITQAQLRAFLDAHYLQFKRSW